MASARIQALLQDASPRTPPMRSNMIRSLNRPCSLPLVDGGNPDLFTIEAATFADLVYGRYDKLVSNYTIVDCRFPYEYQGGHVAGAINLYTEEMVEQYFFPQCPELAEPKANDPENRHVVIFHCEYSLRRGPRLMSHLLRLDRRRNFVRRPHQDYPEVYLLDDGYSRFYESFAHLCFPKGYVRMLDPRYEEELEKLWVERRQRKQPKRRILSELGQARSLVF